LLEWRKLVCGVMMFIVPVSLMGQDSARAMLHDDGGVWLNGSPAPNSTAIFAQDLIQTQKGNRAKIDADGSTVMIDTETIVQFDGDELVLDHGGVQVNTLREMKVRVNCLMVVPLNEEWTRYDVIDVDGRVTVAAHQNDVKIHYQGAAARRAKEGGPFSDVTVHQGEQVTREEHCGAAARPADVINANGPFLNSMWAKAAAGIAIGVVTCWALCRGDDPISPDKP
jgi:hypothetical protein